MFATNAINWIAFAGCSRKLLTNSKKENIKMKKETIQLLSKHLEQNQILEAYKIMKTFYQGNLDRTDFFLLTQRLVEPQRCPDCYTIYDEQKLKEVLQDFLDKEIKQQKNMATTNLESLYSEIQESQRGINPKTLKEVKQICINFFNQNDDTDAIAAVISITSVEGILEFIKEYHNVDALLESPKDKVLKDPSEENFLAYLKHAKKNKEITPTEYDSLVEKIKGIKVDAIKISFIKKFLK